MLRAFFNAVLQGKTVNVKAKYSKPQLHVLSIDPTGMPPVPDTTETFLPANCLLNVSVKK